MAISPSSTPGDCVISSLVPPRTAVCTALLLLGAVLIGACSGPPDVAAPRASRPWTVLVYMIADNNLEPFALEDLTEMVAASASEGGPHIVVQIDRALGFTDSGVGQQPDWTSARRFEVRAGGLVLLDDLGEVDMADPGTLRSFISWAAPLFPAEHYGLILWDHGVGWLGFGRDLSQPKSSLSIQELADAIAGARADTGLGALDLLGFDACLMASLETAVTLSSQAKLLIASEALEPGFGWNYAALAAARDTSPRAVGQAILARFGAHAAQAGVDHAITLSVVDLTQISTVVDALDTLATALTTLLKGGIGSAPGHAVGVAASKPLRFGDSPDPTRARYLLDLGGLAQAFADADPQLAPLGDALSAALSSAVLERVDGVRTRAATGLSIYLAPTAALYRPEYDQLPGASAPWRAFLRELHRAGGDLDPAGLRFVDSDGLADIDESGGGFAVSGQLAPESVPQVADAVLEFGVRDLFDGRGALMVLGSVAAEVAAEGRVSAWWDATALVLEQDGKQRLAYAAVDYEPPYILAAIPVAVTSGGAERFGMLQVVAGEEEGLIYATTLYEYSDTGFGEMTTVPGARIVPMVQARFDDGETAWISVGGESIDANRPYSFGFVPLPPGTQIGMQLRVTDLGQNEASLPFQTTL